MSAWLDETLVMAQDLRDTFGREVTLEAVSQSVASFDPATGLRSATPASQTITAWAGPDEAQDRAAGRGRALEYEREWNFMAAELEAPMGTPAAGWIVREGATEWEVVRPAFDAEGRVVRLQCRRTG